MIQMMITIIIMMIVMMITMVMVIIMMVNMITINRILVVLFLSQERFLRLSFKSCRIFLSLGPEKKWLEGFSRTVIRFHHIEECFFIKIIFQLFTLSMFFGFFDQLQNENFDFGSFIALIVVHLHPVLTGLLSVGLHIVFNCLHPLAEHEGGLSFGLVHFGGGTADDHCSSCISSEALLQVFQNYSRKFPV